MITFRCPNGHKINSREELVGKSGKCPKCQAPFTVPPVSLAVDPVLSGAAAPTVGQGDPFEFALLDKRDGEGPTPAASPRPSPATSAPRGDQADVVFLCPNGHKLNSPARMIGRPGQCPHCQAKFLVPDPLDLAEEDSLTPGEAVPARPATIDAPPGSPEKTTAELVAMLWSCKSSGAVVELHLRGQQVLAPDSYSSRYSTNTHGLFGEQEANGNQRLWAISWDAIERISVRGADKLPTDLFDPPAAAD